MHVITSLDLISGGKIAEYRTVSVTLDNPVATESFTMPSGDEVTFTFDGIMTSNGLNLRDDGPCCTNNLSSI